MKWIGQHIYDNISRFRNDVYLEDISSGTIASGGNLGLDSNNKIVKAAEVGSSVDLTSEVTGTLPVANGGTGATSLASGSILTGTGTSAITANSYLIFSNDAGETDTSTFQILSNQDTGDLFRVQTTTHGATSFGTLDDDATAAHLTFSADGDVSFSANTNKINKTYDFHGTTFENTYSDDEGSGTILKYSPGADESPAGSELFFLHTDGTWNQTDADAVATGASQLLGVGLGASARTTGVLIKGFVKIASTEILNTPGSGAVDGLPVYVSTTAGHFDFTAPSGSSDFVRIVGYAIDDDSSDVLSYFDPDKTWVEIA